MFVLFQNKLQEDFDTVQQMLEEKEREIDTLTRELSERMPGEDHSEELVGGSQRDRERDSEREMDRERERERETDRQERERQRPTQMPLENQ